MTEFTAAERAALDRATVPAMRGGLARDIVAAASAGARRGGRRGAAGGGTGACCWARARWSSPARPRRRPGCSTGCRSAFPASRARRRGAGAQAEARRPRRKAARRAGQAGRAGRHRPAPVPLVDPTPTPQELWRERRAARIAAGLPVRRHAGPARDRREAARPAARPSARPRSPSGGGSRRCRPPSARSRSPRSRADFLARHPKMAQRYEQRLEARAAAADGASRPPSRRSRSRSLKRPSRPTSAAERRRAATRSARSPGARDGGMADAAPRAAAAECAKGRRRRCVEHADGAVIPVIATAPSPAFPGLISAAPLNEAGRRTFRLRATRWLEKTMRILVGLLALLLLGAGPAAPAEPPVVRVKLTTAAGRDHAGDRREARAAHRAQFPGLCR